MLTYGAYCDGESDTRSVSGSLLVKDPLSMHRVIQCKKAKLKLRSKQLHASFFF